MKPSSGRFLISCLADFPDDCNVLTFTPALLQQLLERMQWMGVRRVYWNYYQEGAWKNFADRSPSTAQTLENLGDPMVMAARMSHELGMEFYATIKPYETGGTHSNPKDSPDMLAVPGLPGIGGSYKVDPWVMARPELRVGARTGDMPAGLEKTPITRIQLRQKDMSPIRIKPENLEIWTSDDNRGYRKRDVSFTLTETVETCPGDIVEMMGNLVTRKGEPVRALNVTGLNLLDPFIVVTTNFKDAQGTFRNTAMEMVRAFGPDDEPLPIVVGSAKAVWRPVRDFRTDDLEYDGGMGDCDVRLDVSNESAEFFSWQGEYSGAKFHDGVVGLAKGRNMYVSGSLCEAYPEVQDYWMSWVGDCIAAGADGMDVRISNHSCWANTPDLYGFNEPVADEYQRRYGVNPDLEDFDGELLGAVRGDFFDQFLRRAKTRLSAAGKRMQVHCEMESFRPDANQGRRRSRPGNINFNWRDWLRSGLADEATLFGRSWAAEQTLNDALVQEMLREAADAGVPVHFSYGFSSRNPGLSPKQLEYAYRFGGLSGYTFYETGAAYDNQSLGPDGKLEFRPGLTEGIRDRVYSLGILD